MDGQCPPTTVLVVARKEGHGMIKEVSHDRFFIQLSSKNVMSSSRQCCQVNFFVEDCLEFFLAFFDLVGLDLLAAVEESRKKGWYVETSMPLLWP